MSKKDYVIIAAAIKRSGDNGSTAAVLADALAQDNPRFNRAAFVAACGVNHD